MHLHLLDLKLREGTMKCQWSRNVTHPGGGPCCDSVLGSELLETLFLARRSWWQVGLCEPKALPELPPEEMTPCDASGSPSPHPSGLPGSKATTTSSVYALRKAIQIVGGTCKSLFSTMHSGLSSMPGSYKAPGFCSPGMFFPTEA